MAHNMLHRATTWAGENLKPGGYTGALMDAGYLGWPDIWSGVGRGLLDYSAQRRAANQWRPLGAPPPPVVNPSRSFDAYNASLASAVNQRVALQQLQLKNQFYSALGVSPGGGTDARVSTVSQPVARAVVPPPAYTPFVSPTAGGVGRDLRAQPSITSTPVSTPVSMPVSTQLHTAPASTLAARIQALPTTIKDAARISNDPMKVVGDYWAAVGGRTPNYDWYVSPQLNDGKPIQLSDAHAQAFQSMPNIQLRPHEAKPTMMTVVDTRTNKPVQITSRQYTDNPKRYDVHIAKDWEIKPYIIDGNIDYLTPLQADAITDKTVVPFARDMLTPRSVMIDGVATSVTSAELMKMKAEAQRLGMVFNVTPYDAALQPVSEARHAQDVERALIGRLKQGEQYVEADATDGEPTRRIALIPGSEAHFKYHSNRNKQLTIYETFVGDSANTIARIDRIIEGFTNDPILSSGYGFLKGWVPNSYQLQIFDDVEGLLSVIGFDALAEMRNNSKSGASGLGQLTEMEMRLLQSLQGKLNTKNPEGLLRNIKQIRERMVTLGERMRVAYNEDYGVEDKGAYKLDKAATKYAAGTVVRDKQSGAFQIMFGGKWLTEKDFLSKATPELIQQFNAVKNQ